MRDYRTQVVFPIHILNACLDVVLMVDTDHHAGLVITLPIIARNLHFRLKLTAVGRIEKGSVIHGEAIVCDAPIVALRRGEQREFLVFDLPLARLVEPLHLLQRLCADRS